MTFDENGKPIKGTRFKAKPTRVRAPKRFMSAVQSDTERGVNLDKTAGGALWRLMHPYTVQDEYVATGKPAPSVAEIMREAAVDFLNAPTASPLEIATDAKTAAEQYAPTVASAGKWIVAGLVALAVIEIMGKLPRSR